MPALNFQRQFVPDIESGKKQQTIRPAGKREFKVGDKLYLYTGQRTKSCRKIGEAVCSEVVPITIKFVSYTDRDLTIFGEDLFYLSVDDFAKEDGFENWKQFEEFIIKTYNLKPGDSKEFVIIKWRDFQKADGRP